MSKTLQHRRLFVLSVILIGCFLAAFSYAYNDVEKTEIIQSNIKEKLETKNYIVGENLSDEHYYKLMRDETGQIAERIKSYIASLNANEEFIFLSQMAQPISIFANYPAECEYGYETGEHISPDGINASMVKALQTNPYFFDANEIKINEGTIFTDNDLEYRADTEIPIVLGNAYKGWMNPGDKISGLYFGESMQFVVSGIMEKDSFMYYGGNYQNCDRYIIMPFMNCLETFEWAKPVLLQSTCGLLISDLPEEQVVSFFDECKRKNNFTNWEFTILTDTRKQTIDKQYLEMSDTVTQNYRNITLFMGVLCFIAVTFTMIQCVEVKLNKYAVFILTGDSYCKIYMRILGQIVELLVFGEIVAICMLVLFEELGNGFGKAQLLVFVLLVLTEIITCKYLKRERIVECIKGKD